MTIQKDRNIYKFIEKEGGFSKSVHSWLAQYDEEDDFLCGKVPITLADSTQEEIS